MINGFDNKVIKFSISLMSEYGEDSNSIILTKKVSEIKQEIKRVKNIPYYRGEDNFEIIRIENLILEQRKIYIKRIENLFLFTIFMKLYLIKFRKRYNKFNGIGYNKILKNWTQNFSNL